MVRVRALASCLLLMAACAGTPAIHRLDAARSVATDLMQHFSTAVTATDDVTAFGQVERTAATLAPLLDGLGFAAEAHRLASFRAGFEEYRTVAAAIRAMPSGSDPRQSEVLARALEQKGALRARCEDDLRALQASLAQRDVDATR